MTSVLRIVYRSHLPTMVYKHITLSACVLTVFFLCHCAEDLLPFGFPNIDMGPQLKVVERTRTATMLCAASGIPDPEVSWFKDFLPVEPALSQGRIKQLRSGMLQRTMQIIDLSLKHWCGLMVFGLRFAENAK